MSLGTPPGRAVPGRAQALDWRVWVNLWIVYVVGGSTYLAIRVMVETVPPLLGAGARFVLAGAVMLAVLGVRRVERPTRAQLGGALLVGVLLMGANGVVSIGLEEVPSALAALLIAAVPLLVIVLRRLAGERVPGSSVVAVLVGFAGIALLIKPGEQSGDATVLGLLTCVIAAAMWAGGAFASPRVELPRNQLASAGWQLLLGGLVCMAAGLAVGEASTVDLTGFSLRSLVAVAYLVVFGSLIAFTSYSWLLQNAPISTVSTYAYVNPVIAIVLGGLILDEAITPVMLAGAVVIVGSVALVVRSESVRG